MSDGGGRDDSEDVRDSECEDRVGEFRAGMNGKYECPSSTDGTSRGAVSSMEGECGRDIEEAVDGAGWYDRLGESGLFFCEIGKPCFEKRTRAIARRLGGNP